MRFSDNNSIYMQIAERICDEILEDKFPPGERIPSIREYAALVEVNANTVVRSYEWLQMQEIIFNKRGIGYFVSPDGVERIRQMRRSKFYDNELPQLFKRLYMLDISIDDIDARYAEYIREKEQGNS